MSDTRQLEIKIMLLEERIQYLEKLLLGDKK